MKVDALAGDVVMRLHQSLQAARIVVFRYGRREDVLQDRGRDDVVSDGDRFASSIEAGRYPLQGGGAINVVLHVLLAGPDDLDWFADCPGNERSLQHEVHEQPATESATKQGTIYRDLLGWQVQHGSQCNLRKLIPLKRSPNRAGIIRHMRRAVHRFHRRVRQELRFVLLRIDGGEFAAHHVAAQGLALGLYGFPDIAIERGSILRVQARLAEPGVWSVFKSDFERFEHL